jgi:chromosome partitioning protein
MKVITNGAVKGGTSKSTISMIFCNSIAASGKKLLAIDADPSNHSLSFFYNKGIEYEDIQARNVFNVFNGGKIEDNVLKITDNLDLLHGDVHLNGVRGMPSSKKLKKALKGLPYDFVLIDTAPIYDTILGTILLATDTLIIPIQQDIYSYQALQYLFEQIADLDLGDDDFDVQIVFSQFRKPQQGERDDSFKNELTNIFHKNELFKDSINPCRLSYSTNIQKYTNDKSFRINMRQETQKQHSEISALVKSITGITIPEEI